jgi:hypothetical protein
MPAGQRSSFVVASTPVRRPRHAVAEPAFGTVPFGPIRVGRS